MVAGRENQASVRYGEFGDVLLRERLWSLSVVSFNMKNICVMWLYRSVGWDISCYGIGRFTRLVVTTAVKCIRPIHTMRLETSLVY